MAQMTDNMRKAMREYKKDEKTEVKELKQLVLELRKDLDTLRGHNQPGASKNYEQKLIAESNERKRDNRRLQQEVDALKSAVNSLIRR